MGESRLSPASGKTPWKGREKGGSSKSSDDVASKRLPRATGNYKRMGSGSGKSEPSGHRLSK